MATTLIAPARTQTAPIRAPARLYGDDLLDAAVALRDDSYHADRDRDRVEAVASGLLEMAAELQREQEEHSATRRALAAQVTKLGEHLAIAQLDVTLRRVAPAITGRTYDEMLLELDDTIVGDPPIDDAPRANEDGADEDGIAMTDRARLLALFDHAWLSSADLVVWQVDEPDAPDALAAWATANGVYASGSRLSATMCGHDVVLDVIAPGAKRTRITVYVLAGPVKS